jgi:hypothetical protein
VAAGQQGMCSAAPLGEETVTDQNSSDSLHTAIHLFPLFGMDSPLSEQQAGLKRKRSPAPGVAEEVRTGASAGPSAGGAKGTGNLAQINYLVRAKGDRLRLIEGDNETFGDVLGMIDDYEGMFGHGIRA